MKTLSQQMKHTGCRRSRRKPGVWSADAVRPSSAGLGAFLEFGRTSCLRQRSDLGRDLREGTAKSEEEVVGKQDRKSTLRSLRNLLSDKEEKAAVKRMVEGVSSRSNDRSEYNGLRLGHGRRGRPTLSIEP